MSPQSSKPRGLVFWALVLVGIAFLGYFGWRWFQKPQPKPEPDMVAVARANHVGVGHMEQFNYPAAVAAFEKVVGMAPDWLPGRINLGIALLNTAAEENLDRAIREFQDVLQKEADNPYAHHCLGLIHDYRAQTTDALTHFEAVLKKDPSDSFAWYYVGKQMLEDDKRAKECFQKALELNPYMNAARYKLSGLLRFEDPAQADKLLAEHEHLKDAKWSEPSTLKYIYTEMGPYAEVIGRMESLPPTPTGPIPLFRRDEKLQVRLAGDARWAKRDDLRKAPYGELRAEVRARFGAALVLLDYNRDGKPDLFFIGAVLDGGKVRDLLLRNDGAGGFTDVTAEAGLAASRPALGCCVADFDNDGLPDLFITGVGEQHLFRNSKSGRFEEVTTEAGLDQLKSVCLGAAFVDLDQDADLDLMVAQFAASPEDALATLRGQAREPSKVVGLAAFANVGEAPAAAPHLDPPPLKPRFRRLDRPAELPGTPVAAIGITATDLDADHDVDLIVHADGVAPSAVLNDRLLRFQRTSYPDASIPSGTWNGALVFDLNHDQRSELLFVGPKQRPVLLMNQAVPGEKELAKWFRPGAVDSPPLLLAQAIDIDLDSWTDVVGLTADGKPVLLHNDGRRLQYIKNGLGQEDAWPNDLIGLAVTEFNGDCFPDLLVWSEASGLQLHLSQMNRNHGLLLTLNGHHRVEPQGMWVRCNTEGFGTWIVAQAGSVISTLEYTTLSAGIAQSLPIIVLGLGYNGEADVLRLRWPDLCVQAELNVAACQLKVIDQKNLKPDSCPILFTWDGERFVYVTDLLGAGTLGETLPNGVTNTPRPEESVKIEAHQLRPRDAEYLLKVAEPMQEITYLDRLQLVVLDHPPDVTVYPDERFVLSGVQPSQDLLAFRQRIFPVKARDHRGRDVTRTLREWDRDTARDFHRRTWLGFAEEHWVELDFGQHLAKFGATDRLFLCLAGWTDYPYPDSMWAANQVGITAQPPVLERQTADGKWEALGETGFPAGLPRMMTFEVTGKLSGPRCVIRLRTNMQIYWDQIYLAPLQEVVQPGKPGTVRATTREVKRAELESRGFMQEYSPDGRPPTVYDHDRIDTVPISRMSGRLTRLGDVTELLQGVDDCFAIFGPGDEVTALFDARGLPELAAGWTRSFVLRSWGYCKGSGPFTATGATIEPLPFRAMSRYPYAPDEHYPTDAAHTEYQGKYNTRQVGKLRR